MSVPPNTLGDAFAPAKLWMRLIVMHFRWLWGSNCGSVSRRLPRFNAGENYCQAQWILLPYKSKLASILLHSFMITALPWRIILKSLYLRDCGHSVYRNSTSEYSSQQFQWHSYVWIRLLWWVTFPAPPPLLCVWAEEGCSVPNQRCRGSGLRGCHV